MTDTEQVVLATAMIPLEVLLFQITEKPYKEMTLDFQVELATAIGQIRGLLFCQKAVTA